MQRLREAIPRGYSGSHATRYLRGAAKPRNTLHKLPETALILQWVFTDPSLPKGTQVVFAYTSTGGNAPDKVNGPFKSSKKYYAVFQLPTPNDPKPSGGITIGGTTVGHSVVGVPFPGTEVEIGVKNDEVFTTDANAP